MARLSVTRLLDTAKLLATTAGSQLTDLIEYTNNTFSEVIRALRNGLTFRDNFDAFEREFSLKHDTEGPVFTNSRTPRGIFVMQVVSGMYAGQVAWRIDERAQVLVKPTFSPTPAAGSETQTVRLLITF